MKSLGPIPLPEDIKKEIIAILRLPHKYKDSRVRFERKISASRLRIMPLPVQRCGIEIKSK